MVDHGQDNPVIAAAIKPKGVADEENESSGTTSDDSSADDNKEVAEEDKN